MEKIRRFLSAILISAVCISSFSMPVYADEATPSEIVSISEFVPEINPPVASVSDIPLFSDSAVTLDAPTVTNTVNLSYVDLQLKYYNMSGVVKYVNATVDSNGEWSLSRPSDYASPVSLAIILQDGSFPPLGKYNFKTSLRFNSGVTFSGTPSIQSNKSYNNASNTYLSSALTDYVTDLDAYAAFSIDLATEPDNLYVYFYLDSLAFNTSGFCNGTLAIAFSRLSSSASTDTGVAGGNSVSDSDYQQGITNTVGDIANSVSAVDDSIRELIQTISNQLTALWNQFASEFTNFYTAWQNHTNSIVQAIQAISTAATDGIENIISSADKNAQDIQDNADKNTDQITNGYDNSGMTSENERLDGAISGYEDVESGIKDDVTGYIHDFDMPSWDNIFAVPGVLSAAGFIGGFMQDCFDGMGIWNIQITLSLTFIFVLMLIGYHRFRR